MSTVIDSVVDDWGTEVRAPLLSKKTILLSNKALEEQLDF